jgi:hypothetical protein
MRPLACNTILSEKHWVQQNDKGLFCFCDASSFAKVPFPTRQRCFPAVILPEVFPPSQLGGRFVARAVDCRMSLDSARAAFASRVSALRA